MARPLVLFRAAIASSSRNTLPRPIAVHPMDRLFFSARTLPIRHTGISSSDARSIRSFHESSSKFRAPVPSHPTPPSSLRPSTSGSTASLSGLNGTGTLGSGAAHVGAGAGGKKKSSGHLVWYREIVPAMIPILLLSTTIFLLLSLSRTHLSAERSLADSQSQISALEAQLMALRKDAQRRVEKERKERERMLPLVVEKVLMKVGAMRASAEVDEDGENEGTRELLV